MATEKRTTNYRSSVSGKYVQKDSARRRPKTTVKETDKAQASKAKTSKTKRPRARATTTATTTRTTARRGRSTRR